MIAEANTETVDPRIRRTRELLQQALEKLLDTKDLDKISVQEIADAATVNRATFYDHYTDKFALLECLVARRFHELLAKRQVSFDSGCSGALQALVLALCDYLTGKREPPQDEPVRQFEPHMESAIIAVIRRMLLEGARKYRPQNGAAPELIAATVGWAVYGAAKEWVQTPNRGAAEDMAETVTGLLGPILHGGQPQILAQQNTTI
jgi:AcrR family transcriptional regulator